MAKMQFDVEKIKNAKDKLSQTLTDKAHELAILPDSCRWICTPVHYPDGRTELRCDMFCDGDG
jgi:hypothetical protein